jgi:hypothetical protein
VTYSGISANDIAFSGLCGLAAAAYCPAGSTARKAFQAG